ncbi:pneumococcal serine-rich repeat protein isoform X1 [Sardina pilchardus]|uniref:pneumococcal serine-rich repeat protein isoform X1 n=1 Tax=Sardina pilchardus TaxID=27697 RepID=UPI002E1556F6
MAENVRSPFDYREPPTLDSDGDGSKPPPPRGRVCGRKRKGTPVKVCDRAYVTEDEEESMSEHSYSPGDGQYPEGAEDRLPPPGSPYYLADPSQLCVPELGEEGASGVRGPVLFHPPPNCRIREVHCGSQVRLVVIAIRDIAKGEEITVDYSLTDWGDNTMSFHSSVSPRGFECSFNPENNIKKEEESGPLPLSLTVSDYLTPSWSLSPSSSPLSHSEASDSDREDEEEEEEEDDDEDEEEEEDLEELRGRMMRRRKKRKTSASPATAAAAAPAATASSSSSAATKKKASAGRPPAAHRGPSLSFSRSASSSASPSTATAAFQAPLAPPPTTNINNNININIGHRGSLAGAPRRQHCAYCGRHFRSLARHLEKYHAQQPEVRAAMELAQMRAHNAAAAAAAGPHASSSSSSSAAQSSSSATHSTFASPQPSSSSAATAPTSLFSRENAQGPGAVSFSLSLSQPSRKTPAAALSQSRKNTATMSPLNTQPGKSPPVPAATAAAATRTPAKRGRRPKKEKEEQLKQEELERAKEEAPPTPGREEEEEEEEVEEEEEEEEDEGEAELSDGQEDESLEGKNGEMARPHRTHMPPLLSSLSCLVLYLRRQQHSAFLSLSRSPGSAEAWRLLCHSSLALLILYNRHRECEVAKLTIQEYRNRFTPPPPPMASSPAASSASGAAATTNGAASSSSNGTGGGGGGASSGSGPAAAHPLEVALSPFERHVLCHLPRAGVVGKRGRMQPLILPPHSEACLELLLSTCAQVGVDPQSPYVFSRPYHSPATPLRGTDLLRGLARSSGAKNPAALTAPRARRQVAILTQLLLLEEGERKRLEDFLQREYHVTQSCARIGQDPGLMGRVGRVVLYGERDGVLFRGMSLQQICLELDVMSGNSADSFSDDSDVEGDKAKERVEVGKKGAAGSAAKKKGGKANASAAVTPAGHKRRGAQPKSGKRGVLKRPWSEAERVAVETHLKRNIMELRVPAKADCERCLQLCPLLVTNQRDWRAIKFYCHNRIQLLKKQGRREANGAAIC